LDSVSFSFSHKVDPPERLTFSVTYRKKPDAGDLNPCIYLAQDGLETPGFWSDPRVLMLEFADAGWASCVLLGEEFVVRIRTSMFIPDAGYEPSQVASFALQWSRLVRQEVELTGVSALLEGDPVSWFSGDNRDPRWNPIFLAHKL
jgi:hypothetical protein